MKRLNLRTRIFVMLMALVLTVSGTRAQDPGSQAPPTLVGTEYYVAFLPNEGSVSRFMGLMISSEVATNGTVEIPGAGSKTFTTQPGQVTMIPVSRTLEPHISEEASQTAVRITSRAPVAVFVVNSLYQSTGGYAAIPTNLWGTRYLPISLPNAEGTQVSQLTIIAYDNTFITIRPSARTFRRDKGEIISQWLKPGETFLVQAHSSGAWESDLSGSEISSTRPIAVISGHVRAAITLDGSKPAATDWASHQVNMLLPDSLYSNEYYTVPQRASGDRFRLMPINDNTNITIAQYRTDGTSISETIKLDRGLVLDRMVALPTYWKADGPFVLVQLRTSGSYANPNNSPAMMPVAPLDQLSSRSVFVAPGEIGGDGFALHSLTLLARGPLTPSASDPDNPLRQIKLDGKPVHEMAPELLTQSIGNTGMYYVTITLIPSGGHLITSQVGYPLTGIISGNNGNIARDSYSWALPFWVEPVGPDFDAPYITSVDPTTPKSIIAVTVSDQTDTYFSGVASVSIVNSPGWTQDVFITPDPDSPAPAVFRAVGDPTGPLDVKLTDRDGNERSMRLSQGICFKTAVPEVAALTIATSSGAQFERTIALNANPCGDTATVMSVITGGGTAAQYLNVAFDKVAVYPFTILPGTIATLRVTPNGTIPMGTYTTNLAVKVDDSTVVIPVTLTVGPTVGVEVTPGIPVVSLNLRIYPNPFSTTTTIALDRPLGPSAELTIVDQLGRLVYSVSGRDIAGRTMLGWNGSDEANRPLSSGLYLLTISDRGNRIVRGVTVVR